MSIPWTKEQNQVITLRNRNILVSAAAGSGKTAVLVERIIKRILDPHFPVDIDKMLIVTFTNAAAAEMRERIALAIEKALEESPEDENLQKQATLVHHAQITTIHSFCLSLIRDYFHKIDLEPNFRIAEVGELNLLKEEVMDKLLIKNYENEAPEFLRFVESFATGKKDSNLKDQIFQLYLFSMSYPWPNEWLNSLDTSYEEMTISQLEEAQWVKALIEFLKNTILDVKKQVSFYRSLASGPDGPAHYLERAIEEEEQLENLFICHTYQEFSEEIMKIEFKRLPSLRNVQGNEEIQELFKTLRDEVKDIIKKLKSQFFYDSIENMMLQLKDMGPVVKELIRLTEEFSQEYQKKKRAQNLLDFNDLEHFAIEILIDRETKEATEVAKECQTKFEEVMIDEYQDSNLVQESLLLAVSREKAKCYNRFMVGDVKQSIYRFRLARPEIFMEKYKSYSKEESTQQKIELHQNFRSREEVLSFSNAIFFSIMKQSLGKVEYNEDAALHKGANYEDAIGFSPELLLADEKDDLLDEMQIDSKAQLEGLLIANRIKEYILNGQVTDKSTGRLRSVNYSDIVILLRSFGSTADVFMEVFDREGIPAHVTSKTGYFKTVEIKTLLSLLRILDNPYQDLPLAAVMRSPIGGFTDEELSLIRGENKKIPFYQQVFDNQRSEEKLLCFRKKIDEFRDLVEEKSIHELLVELLRLTGYQDYVTAMVKGEKRRGNIDMLLEKAIAFEKTSYRGLFHFIRYMDRLISYEVDYGEAETINENENAVRIMTIHKSKGLEFSVVFVSGLGKQFNKQDLRNQCIIHPELGLGLDYINPDLRVKMPTLLKRTLAKMTDLENLGEELRVLYVALTRAKEKLILTGTLKDFDQVMERMNSTWKQKTEIGFATLSSARSFLDWILPALFIGNREECISCFSTALLVSEEIKEQVSRRAAFEQMLSYTKASEEKMSQEIKQRLEEKYKYESDVYQVQKYSVSELKHRSMEALQEAEEIDQLKEKSEKVQMTKQIYIPEFMQQSKNENIGAARGSATHRILECLSVKEMVEQDGNPIEIKKQIQQLVVDQKIPKEYEQLVLINKLSRFYQSSLAKRMAKAENENKLYLEMPFVMSLPAHMVEEKDSDTPILIQGIIDVFFEEEDRIILMDYKTDVITSPKELVDRYERQIKLYGKAIEGAMGKKVEEMILYSFYLDKEVTLSKLD